MPPVRNGLCARNNARGRGKAVAILPPGVEAVVLTVIQQLGGRRNARPTLRAERALICGSKCRKPTLRKRSSPAAAKKGKQGIQKGRKTHTGCPPLLPPRRAAHRPRCRGDVKRSMLPAVFPSNGIIPRHSETEAEHPAPEALRVVPLQTLEVVFIMAVF